MVPTPLKLLHSAVARIFAVATVVASACIPAHSATFSQTSGTKPSKTTLYYNVTGSIAVGDAARFQAILNEKKAEPGKTNIWVLLDARGGDLEESFRLGRLLRKYNAYTSHGQCVGSCVYAFMGGKVRHYTPSVPHPEMSPTPPDMTGLWVYEPYVMAKVLPMAASNPPIAQALKNVKDYTLEMTGKTKFYDSVIKIPHTKPIRMNRNNVFDMNVGSLEASDGSKQQALPMGEKPPAW